MCAWGRLPLPVREGPRRSDHVLNAAKYPFEDSPHTLTFFSGVSKKLGGRTPYGPDLPAVSFRHGLSRWSHYPAASGSPPRPPTSVTPTCVGQVWRGQVGSYFSCWAMDVNRNMETTIYDLYNRKINSNDRLISYHLRSTWKFNILYVLCYEKNITLSVVKFSEEKCFVLSVAPLALINRKDENKKCCR